jgi:hypothetical protein
MLHSFVLVYNEYDLQALYDVTGCRSLVVVLSLSKL